MEPIAIIAIVGVLTYFFPFLLAAVRDHPQVWPIFWLTVFLGWTGLGWVVAFIWAVFRFRKTDDLTEA